MSLCVIAQSIQNTTPSGIFIVNGSPCWRCSPNIHCFIFYFTCSSTNSWHSFDCTSYGSFLFLQRRCMSSKNTLLISAFLIVVPKLLSDIMCNCFSSHRAIKSQYIIGCHITSWIIQLCLNLLFLEFSVNNSPLEIYLPGEIQVATLIFHGLFSFSIITLHQNDNVLSATIS